MSNFPTETSPAGMILASAAVLVPLGSILVSSLIGSAKQGFWSAWAINIILLTLSFYFALEKEPGSGTALAIWIIGGATLLLCSVITLSTYMFRRRGERKPSSF